MKLPLITAAERNLPSIGSAALLLDADHREVANVKWPEDAQEIKRACNSHAALVEALAWMVEAHESGLLVIRANHSAGDLAFHEKRLSSARAALAQAKQG